MNLQIKKSKSISINILKYLAVVLLTIFVLNIRVLADDAGSRAAFTRGGWVGASYVAMGMAGEVIADDVYALYWNPAGLAELKDKKRLSEEEIKERAKKGKFGDLSESDLLSFSEDKLNKSVLQIGISAAMLDVEREAGFTGMAFNAFNGVMGIGLYSIVSRGIERRDESGNLMGNNLNYVGSSFYLSYGWSAGISSIGFSLKGLYERIGNVEYMGGGSDFGVQVYLLPFFKIGFVVQDIGSGLVPREKKDGIENKYDFASPSIRFGGSLTSDTGVTIALSSVKKFEQDEFQLRAGLKYILSKSMTVYVGINEINFSTGFTLNLLNMGISYAFSFDKIDLGYNNLVSISMLF